MMLLFLLACAGQAVDTGADRNPIDLVPLVDPKIGTGGVGFGVGCGFPGASAPNGLVKLSPDTSTSTGLAFGGYRGGGYHADDTRIRGFSHVHLHGVGLTDYGLISFMPVDGPGFDRIAEDDYRAPFSHDEADARAGYYAVTLEDTDVRVELAATPRTGLQRYTFPADSSPGVVFDLAHVMGEGIPYALQLDFDPSNGAFSGFVAENGAMADDFTVYFAGAFDQIPTDWGLWEGTEQLAQGTSAAQGDPSYVPTNDAETPRATAGGWFAFADPVVNVRVAVSVVDVDGARANLTAEHDGFDIDSTVTATQALWAEKLGAIQVEGGTPDEQVRFATALYHTLLMPTRMDDVDGRYRGIDADIHQTDAMGYYTDMSLWDTYRTTHPLYTALWPDLHREFLTSLSRMAEEGGSLPKWPLATEDGGFMVGSPAHIVAGEAWQKGLRDFGEGPLFEMAASMALRGTAPDGADLPYGARPDVLVYGEYGYYPADLIGTSVAWTQEVALADFALAQAHAAGAPMDDADAAELATRSGWWRNVYDTDTGWFHARSSDGAFMEMESDAAWLDEYTEGNARQYLWMAPHDPEALADVLGGTDAAIARLDDFFEESVDAEDDLAIGVPRTWYWHGNEIDVHAAWLFSLWGDHARTVKWVDWILDSKYGSGADGLAGNDDGGTLSAWYVWAAMGVYPMAGTDQYAVGAPRFDRVRLPIGDGFFTIERVGAGPIAAITLNGAPLVHPRLRHADLIDGGSLRFYGAEPLP